MSARGCSTCQRRVRWWQILTPKSRQCSDCFVQGPDSRPGKYPNIDPEELELRLIKLLRRGLHPEVVDSLWVSGSEHLVSFIENATARDIEAVNEAWDERRAGRP